MKDYVDMEEKVAAVYLDKLTDGKDIHRLTASKLFDVKYAEVTEEQRKVGKTVNFYLVYGGGKNI